MKGKSAKQVLREIALANPKKHGNALARGYGAGPTELVPHALLGIPIHENPDPKATEVYHVRGAGLVLPRWMVLLYGAGNNHYEALRALQRRYVEDVDRRLKEKGL